MKLNVKLSTLALACALGSASLAYGDTAMPSKAELADKAWMNTSLSADARTQAVLKEMTMDEKLKLVFGYFGTDALWKNFKRPAESYAQSAGFIYGVPRLGIPNLWETDAGLGVASQVGPDVREATALPSGLNTAATWNPEVGFAGGAMIGNEAREYGFNVMLAGGVNIMREPRNGRNFEYAGEDPLLAGTLVGAQISGIQSQHVISTLKHFAFNDQETGRFHLNVKIEDDVARMSDLLALQIANEKGKPGSVMCAYNRVNGHYACENDYLLNQVLKTDWGFKGFVMSDWGATHSTVPAANAGLDQQSGIPFDQSEYFGAALKEAVMNGWVSETRLDDMASRVLYAMFEHGLVDQPVGPTKNIDWDAHAKVTQTDSEEGMVLLKNTGKLLPLTNSYKKIAVIGAHADAGVPAGGGSSLVYPRGGMAVKGLLPATWPGPIMFYPSSPMKAIAKRAPDAKVSYASGTDLAAASKLAAESDVVVLFANQWTGESVDALNLSLPDNQDALIAAVVKANPKTVVVLETGGPVTMPWVDQVGSIVEAWYPGTAGGEAIGRVLFGEVNPSGHLPATFPVSEKQLPRPALDGDPKNESMRFDVDYSTEGAAVGYKWFDLKGMKPLFPFGHGLSYTEFAYSDLKAEVVKGQLNVSFSIKNTGAVAGKDVAQVYVAPVKAKWEAPKRLGGFKKVDLKPGESTSVTLSVDPRLLAMYHSKDKTWHVEKGDYEVILAKSATEPQTSVKVRLPKQVLDVNGK